MIWESRDLERFNGAAPGGAENHDLEDDSGAPRAASMGPRRGARKIFTPDGICAVVALLQWGRAGGRGKSPHPAPELRRQAVLQWGRAGGRGKSAQLLPVDFQPRKWAFARGVALLGGKVLSCLLGVWQVVL
jgi:hypothetical protein